jgi:hypothetical protein
MRIFNREKLEGERMKSEKEIRETIAKFEEIKNETYDKGKFLVASSITTIIETLKWVLEEDDLK